MKIYMVGGAVRDMLLGRPVRERDFVVVGATPAEMLELGFQQVGRDFPVFLHPQTKEEYALARSERRRLGVAGDPSAYTQPNVTLEQDLLRRDLTVNAIAVDAEGEVIDPYNGRKDLELKVLRHVSNAFAEDPVRVLRVARFAARYGELGFSVAQETLALMANIVTGGEVDNLVPERIWQELVRALGEPRPCLFFEVLGKCGAWKRLFPEIREDEQVMGVLEYAASISQSQEIRFAALAGSMVTTEGSSAESIVAIESLCKRLRAPKRFYELALLTARYCRTLYSERMSPEQIVMLLEETDAVRRPGRFRKFLLSCAAICGAPAAGKLSVVPRDQLLAALERISGLDAGPLAAGEADPDLINERIRIQRIEAVGKLLEEAAEEPPSDPSASKST